MRINGVICENLFKIDNIDLIFTEDALSLIVKMAMDRNIGARALRSVIEEIMLDIMYDIPSIKRVKTCTINKEIIINKKPPKLVFYKKRYNLLNLNKIISLYCQT